MLGSRGSADTVRDTRGFAVKFYTDEGTFDLVGNNMPVFFIQDGIKFPDIIHAAKPHPDREIPQAQSAHDTFWDFVSLHTEATHHVMWNMSDRGIPRSYRTMEGFGVHTFRLVNADGETSLVKFHWKPVAGVHSLVWEEAQIAAGCDPDFHRRDMADGIEAGAFLEYELGIQVMPDDGTDSFEGIDLLDPTKLVPEELAPVQLIGKLTLNRNPTNYFAETEQVAFHTGNLVPGIEVTNDPLMQARLFSYLDTQLTRLGGPNFTQLPINRPHCPVNDMLRDGMHQTAIHTGTARRTSRTASTATSRSSADDKHGGYVQTPRPIEGTAVRAQPVSFDDHFSQATMFYRSLSPIEQAHVVEAFTFELGKVYEQAIKERELQVLANVDADLCAQVAAGLGLPAPKGEPAEDVTVSPALVQILAEAGPDRRPQDRDHRRRRLRPRRRCQAGESDCGTGVTALVIAPVGGVLKAGRRTCHRRPDAGHRAVHRIRRARRGRGHGADRRHQARRAAAGGVPALQGDRRVGRRRRGPQGRADPEQGAGRRGGRRRRQGLSPHARRRAGTAPSVGPGTEGHGLRGASRRELTVTRTAPGGDPPPSTTDRIKRIGVVVPVNNEQDTLLLCLDALAAATRGVAVPVTVVVVVDACTDGSAAVAASFPMAGLQTVAVNARSVGIARATGMTELLRRHGSSGMWLATTDADSVVPQNWLCAQLRHADAGARVVAGTVAVDDWGDRGGTVAERAAKDYAAGPHRHVHGANLSFAASAYCAAGGFSSVSYDEDVQLVDAFRANGEPIAWATDMPVLTSARRDARAPLGFGWYLSSLEQSLQSRPRSASDVEVPHAI